MDSYQSFEWLHAQIDDDKDGELDARETGDFIAEELQGGSGAKQKHESLHSKHDSLISLQELWDNWKVSLQERSARAFIYFFGPQERLIFFVLQEYFPGFVQRLVAVVVKYFIYLNRKCNWAKNKKNGGVKYIL